MSTPPSYGVAWSDVPLPVDTSAIPVTGGRLSQADLAGFIEAAGIQLTGLVQRAGIDANTLTTQQLLQVQKDILPYAQHQALAKMGNSGPAYTQALARWQAVIAKWSNASSEVPDAGITSLNNLPADAGEPYCNSPWTGRHFRF